MILLPLIIALSITDSTEVRRIAVGVDEWLHVEITGTGTPVIMVPGLFGSSYGYRHVTAMLDSLGYQTIAIEPLGLGRSARPPDADYSLAAQAERIAAVADTLGARDVVFVGHSLGASIGLRVAYRRPDLVAGVVSIEGGPAETAVSRSFKTWMRFAPIAKMLDVRQLLMASILRSMRTVSHDPEWVSERLVFRYAAGLTDDVNATIGAYQGMARSVEPEVLADQLSRVTCPVVLLIGDKEHTSGPNRQDVETLARELPAFSVDTVIRSGYFIQEERPDAIVRTVLGVRGPTTGLVAQADSSSR